MFFIDMFGALSQMFLFFLVLLSASKFAKLSLYE